MKSFIFILTLAIFGKALASHQYTYNPNDLEMLNYVYTSCPAEMEQALKQGAFISHAHLVGGLGLFKDEDGQVFHGVGEVLTVETVRNVQTDFGSTSEIKVAKLEIHSRPKSSKNYSDKLIECRLKKIGQE